MIDNKTIERKPSGRAATAAIVVVLVAASSFLPQPSPAAAPDPRADKLLVVDCLLPGQIRKLGGKRTYLSPRRPVKTTAADCEIRGGEYVAYDRADYGTALEIWLPRAKDGDPEAQTYVGEIFEKGLGTAADYAAAASWYRKAAEQGFTRAQINLGQLYEQGLGVPQDSREALNWYRRASGLEDDELQFASSVRVTMQAKEEQIQQLQAQSQRSAEEAAELRHELEQARAELDARQRELETTRDKLGEIRSELAEQERVIASGTEAGIEQRRRELAEQEARLQAEHRELAELESTVAEQVASLTAGQREAAERNNALQSRLLTQRAEAERLRSRLEQVKQELAESRDALSREEEADAALVARLQAAESERASLEQQITSRQGQIEELRSSLEAARSDLDQSTTRYAEAVSELERRKALHEVELQRVEAERDRLAEERDRLAQQSREDVERIEQLRAELTQQEQAYQERLKTLEREYAESLEKVERTRRQVADAGSGGGSGTMVASAGPPVIELIEPPVTLTRDGNYTASVRGDLEQREVIGRVQAPAGVKVFNVNERPAELDGNGLFRVRVPVRESQTPVSMVVVDSLGQRVSLDFELFRRVDQGSGQAARQTGDGHDGEDFPRIEGLGKYHALVVGNSEYEDFPSLRTPANDARAVADVLENEYGYETRLILDATRYEIISALNEYRANLTSSDNLLIYYAGHGEIDQVNDNGYWLPVDAERNNTANWISTRSISEILNVMAAKHVMVVADSCYSGAMTRSALARLQAGKTVEEWVEWFKKVSRLRTRMVMSSGGEEPVNDGGGGQHSLFAKAFLEVLRQNQRALDGYRFYQTVADLVQESIKKQDLAVDQTPLYAPIKFAGHEAGEFVFQPL